MKQKMQPKDLITVGIFSAIMFIVCMGVAMLGYIPIFIPLLSALVPLIGGIPFMLFLTKVRKFGMVLIMSVLIGLVVYGRNRPAEENSCTLEGKGKNSHHCGAPVEFSGRPGRPGHLSGKREGCRGL